MSMAFALSVKEMTFVRESASSTLSLLGTDTGMVIRDREGRFLCEVQAGEVGFLYMRRCCTEVNGLIKQLLPIRQ